MKSQKFFTLIEMIVVLLIAGALASIVILNIADVKPESISSSISGSTRNLQTAVDKFALNNNGIFPTNVQPTLEQPQPIEFVYLYPNYIKSKVDYQKIKNQLYWVDAFGQVWGATEGSPNITQTDKYLEWSPHKDIKQYNIYKVSKNEVTGSISKTRVKEMKPIEIKKGTEKIQLEHFNQPYLISTVDQYGLESAPAGLGSPDKETDPFNPIFGKTGTFYYEITAKEKMHFDLFQALEDKPEGTSIYYQFAVLEETPVAGAAGKTNLQYGKFVNDFYSLPSSKGIKVKIIMNGANGKYPSIYDLRILYHFELEEGNGELPPFLPELSPPADGFSPLPEINYPPESDSGEETGSEETGGNTETGGETSKDSYIPMPPLNPQPSTTGPKPPVNGGEVNPPLGIVCGSGFTRSYNINGYGDVVDTSKDAFVVYKFKLGEGQYISDIKIQYLNPEFKPTNIWYEYSHNGESYKRAESLSSIPAPSCVSVVYYIKANDLFSPVPPIIEKQTSPPVLQPEVVSEPPKEDTTNPSTPTNPTIPNVPEAPSDSYNPKPSDPEITAPEWVTVDEFQFFAGSQNGEKTDWLYSEIKDKKPEHTRILYYYATSNNGKEWSPYIKNFSSLPDSIYAKAYAVLQVEKNYLGKVEEPSIESVKLVNNYGGIDLDLVTPTVVLTPTKSNNQNSELFSTTTMINWDYIATDPLDKKIVDIKWSGDKRNQYTTPGKYTVQLVVKNELNYWSKPATFTFEVKEEKPVAQITVKATHLMEGMPIEWGSEESFDPDEDGIEKVEWAGDKRDEYDTAGNYTVKLRVQDKEGNWSDWTSKTIVVKEREFIVQRLEAEGTVGTSLGPQISGCTDWQSNVSNTSDYSYSNNLAKFIRGHSCSGVYEQFTFIGNGFDLKLSSLNGNVFVSIDDNEPILMPNTTNYTYSVRNLTNTIHNVKVITRNSTSSYAFIDYLDVVNINTQPTISNVYSRQVDKNDIEGPVNNNSIIPHSSLSGRTYFTLNKNSYVTVIVKQNGSIVKTLLYKEYKDGGSFSTHSFVWDGKNTNGVITPTGYYDIEITAVGLSGKEQTVYTHNVFVDNNKPIQRLEAELPVGTSLGSQISGCTDWQSNVSNTSDYSYSNNLARFIKGYSCSGVYEQFTFTGTGFDLKFGSLTGNVYLSIDDNTPILLPNTTNYIHSIRNLTNTTHNVKVITRNSTSSYAFIDYMDVVSSDTTPNFSNVFARQLDSNGTETMVDNYSLTPAKDQKTKVYYTLDKDSYVTIVIEDNSGDLIKSITTDSLLKGGSYGNHFETWDGKDSSGNNISTGWYKVKITAKGIYKDTEKIHYVSIYVDNNKPIQRLEAEGTVGTSLGPQISGCTDWQSNVSNTSDYSYSNNLARFIKGYSCSGVYEQFTFTGTGFDLKFGSLTGDVYLSIDDNTPILLPNKTNYTYSMRNLTNTTHSVKVITRNSTSSYAFIDYMDVVSSDTKPNFSNVFARQLDANGTETIVDNNSINPIIGQSSKVYYTLDKDSYITIKVKDSSGNTVKNLTSDLFQKGGSEGNQFIVWDGKNDSGSAIPTGWYNVEITAQGIYKDTESIKTVSIYADYNKRIQRLEAEGTVGTSLGPQVSACADWSSYVSYSSDYSYSSNLAKFIRGYSCSGVYEQFIFTGTGFDLKFGSLTGDVYLSIDDNTPVLLPNKTNYTYSMRNLTNTTHKVKVITRNSTSSYAFIDYMDIFSSDTSPSFSNVFTRQLDASGTETIIDNNSINPNLGQTSKIYYTLDKDSYITIKISDSSGNIVRSWTPDTFEEGGTRGNHFIIWNGKNNNGEVVSTAWYKLEITAKGIYKNVETTKNVLIFVDSNGYTQRLEAEGTVGTSLGPQISGCTDWQSYVSNSSDYSYSNNLAKFIRGHSCSGVYEQFTFTGVGFDISIPSTNGNIYLSIDGDTPFLLPNATKYTYSVRNLMNTSHTVKVITRNSTSSYAFIDYLNAYK